MLDDRGADCTRDNDVGDKTTADEFVGVAFCIDYAVAQARHAPEIWYCFTMARRRTMVRDISIRYPIASARCAVLWAAAPLIGTQES